MFVKKGAWVFSCMALMYGLPMMIEYMGEQNKIIMKIMASQDPNGMAMGGGMRWTFRSPINKKQNALKNHVFSYR